ncbi:ATP-binding protein [Nocardiopsis sp. N85]|uniref:sensor histidine kinase n=1 Tax=Nocardiopsis sp. N85 TaxID=3029400 RepID=UPI00237F5188|nr:ATP-binding protein [Nocardiopsis sp. N85]MDE3719843.1 ATP-binding protein [Nocardiopsis sp. N85]
MHQPVHPHSQEPGRTADRDGGRYTAGSSPVTGETKAGGAQSGPPGDLPSVERPVGPFSGSAENGYRPATRPGVPNPYTTVRRVEIDDVAPDVTPVGQWRGVGLDEPEPRTPEVTAPTEHTASEEEAPVQQTPFAFEGPVPSATGPASEPPHTEQFEAPVSHTPASSVPESPLPEPTRRESPQGDDHRGRLPEGGSGHHEPRAAAAEPGPDPDRRHRQESWRARRGPAESDRYASEAPPRGEPSYDPGYGERAPRAEYPSRGEEPRYDRAPRGNPYREPYAAREPRADHRDPYGPDHGARRDAYGPDHGPYGQDPRAPRPEAYRPPPQPPHPQGEYPYPQAPMAYPYPVYPPPFQHPMAYPNVYPPPFQPPGYVVQGQPVFYPGQANPYGQPVQHVIVFTAGQPPQVITADSAATLFAEQTQATEIRGDREDKALTRAEPVEETEPAPDEEPAVDDTTAAVVEEAAPAALTEAGAGEETPREPVGDAPSPVPPAVAGGKGLLNEALAGLAMRDLSLVDALLEMVEELEADAQDPDLLDKLFQIDNFATRMRRNGENFLVLTGHDGGESDAHDEIVPLLDVARAAMSEIKDYPRVMLGKLPQTSITGMAADDISHLLAELLDNATANSPEHSQVVISGQEMDDGRLMIVVEDEGVGIPDRQLAELNERLSGDPVLDEEVPRHMGLYVASRIAKKHGLEAKLESRAFRGVSAYAIVPKELLRVATPRTPGQSRTSTIPTSTASATRSASAAPTTAPPNGKPTGGSAPSGAASSITSAGLPRRSATPHGSPLRMMPRPEPGGAASKARENTPPKLTGEARAEQIRDELGDFLEGERAALEGEDLDGTTDDAGGKAEE